MKTATIESTKKNSEKKDKRIFTKLIKDLGEGLNGINKDSCNVGEFSHDYTIGKDKELSFSFENSANLIKVGLPIYNEKYEEYVIWFYATST